MKARRLLVRHLSRPGLVVVRAVMGAAVPDVVKVAVLVNIAGAAASLARSLVKLRHLDPAAADGYVCDPVDARAVLGRGRWLPAMTRPVPLPAMVDPAVLPAPAPVVLRPARRRPSRVAEGQPELFPLVAARGGAVW